jgi:acyl carrier protein
MSEQDAIAAIVRDISPTIKIEPALYGKPLFDLGLDSLDHATVLLQVEEKFEVKIPDDVAGSMLSVTDIASYVLKNRSS